MKIYQFITKKLFNFLGWKLFCHCIFRISINW